MDWNHVDLNSGVEQDSNLIEPLTFRTLLLEIECNLPEITAQTIYDQFVEDLNSRVTEAWEVFRANQRNILEKALEYRNQE